jgi:hypothetical protein
VYGVEYGLWYDTLVQYNPTYFQSRQRNGPYVVNVDARGQERLADHIERTAPSPYVLPFTIHQLAAIDASEALDDTRRLEQAMRLIPDSAVEKTRREKAQGKAISDKRSIVAIPWTNNYYNPRAVAPPPIATPSALGHVYYTIAVPPSSSFKKKKHKNGFVEPTARHYENITRHIHMVDDEVENKTSRDNDVDDDNTNGNTADAKQQPPQKPMPSLQLRVMVLADYGRTRAALMNLIVTHDDYAHQRVLRYIGGPRAIVIDKIDNAYAIQFDGISS